MICLTNKKLKESNEGVKIYEIKRKQSLPKADNISLYILNHINEKPIADQIQDRLEKYGILIKRDTIEFSSFFETSINVFDEVDYMVVLVSKDFLKDMFLMGILHDNYDQEEERNSGIIPLIISEDLYDPIEMARTINEMNEYAINYNKYIGECMIGGDDSFKYEELKRVTEIIKTAKLFLHFSVKRDKKSDRPLPQKIIKYIECNLKIVMEPELETADREEKVKVDEQAKYITNFYGAVSGVQMQQGNEKAVQVQTAGSTDIDYEQVKRVVEEIKRNDGSLEEAYGNNADEVRRILSEVTTLAEQKKNPFKIREALTTLKDISVGIAGSLIASGIVAMLSGIV